MSDVLLQLKKLKNDPKAGAVSREHHEAAKKRLLAVIGEESGAAGEAPSFATWFFGSFISKPVAAMATAFVLAIGSLSTVNASSGSLPGDTLYSVKRITEQAQLRLASLDKRAVLHTEFAERRLKEATEIRQTTTDPARLTLAKVAMEDYERELTQAGEDLKQLKGTVASTQTFAAVNDVQKKIESMQTVIDQNVAASTTVADGEEALAAKQVTTEAQQVATTVAVEVHEEESSEMTTLEMKEMFRKELGDIEARQTFDEHRIETAKQVLKANAELFAEDGMPTVDDLQRMAFVIKQTRLQIPEAMNGFAAGGYRTAFDTLHGIDAELLALEARLAEIEIIIMNTLATPEEEPVDGEGEAVTDGEENGEEAETVT